jgi:hypothetical protein
MAQLAFHRLALADDTLKVLHRRVWSRREEPADLRIGDHREPRAGVAGLESANDQPRCLKPSTHEQIIEASPPGQFAVGKPTARKALWTLPAAQLGESGLPGLRPAGYDL